MRIGGRVTVRLADGPYKGTWARVDRLMADAVLSVARARFDAYAAAPGEGFDELMNLYRWFCLRARPAWVLEDALGPVESSEGGDGMLRLPVSLGLALVGAWIDTFPPAPDITPPPPEPAPVPRGTKPSRRPGPAGSAAPAAASVALEVP